MNRPICNVIRIASPPFRGVANRLPSCAAPSPQMRAIDTIPYSPTIGKGVTSCNAVHSVTQRYIIERAGVGDGQSIFPARVRPGCAGKGIAVSPLGVPPRPLGVAEKRGCGREKGDRDISTQPLSPNSKRAANVVMLTNYSQYLASRNK